MRERVILLAALIIGFLLGAAAVGACVYTAVQLLNPCTPGDFCGFQDVGAVGLGFSIGTCGGVLGAIVGYRAGRRHLLRLTSAWSRRGV